MTFLTAFSKGTDKMAGDQVCVSMELSGYGRTSLSVSAVSAFNSRFQVLNKAVTPGCLGTAMV